MRHSVTNIFEMMIGAILIALGLFYLTAQCKAVDQLTDRVTETVIDNSGLYQQYNYVDINRVSKAELYAIVMGYHEYPIIIDGVFIPIDENNYEYYLSLIKNGYYIKSYEYDSKNEIIQIVYRYAGA